MRINRSTLAVAAVCLLSVAGGCAERRGGVGVDIVTARRQVHPRPTVQPVDQSGPLATNDAQPPGGRPLPAPAANGPDGISATVEESVRPVDERGFQAIGSAGAPPAATQRAAAPRNPGDAPETTGGYQLIGTVLAEVHDAPIFANKVLDTVDAALAAQAQRLDERQFRSVATDLIEKEIRKHIADELEFAMALRRLEPRDRELARLATIRWRDEQVTKAGGSLAVARQRAAAAGYDFDELVEDRFRWLMRQLYYQKYELPKIQVSATDMRRYYQENRQKEFTSAPRARFRVIKVDKLKSGGRREALDEINRLLERVRGGKDFGELAAEDNDQEAFKVPPPKPFERGSFVVKEVEDAVWNLEPGQVTDVIETPDAFYIAKLDEKQAGGVLPFDEQDVQRRIEATLRKRQFDTLQARVQEQLMRDAIIRYHPRMIDLAVEMAMQKYRYWRQQAAR